METYPPLAWMIQCKALVPNPLVWEVLENSWSWIQAWDSGFTPAYSVACALLDVLAPEVGAGFLLEERP